MNARQALDFLAAAAACDPSGDFAPPARLVDAVAEAAPAAEWEAAVCGGAASTLRLSIRRAGAAGARAAIARILSIAEIDLIGEPAASRPWIETAWNAASGRWTAVEVSSRAGTGEALRVLAPKPGPQRALATRRFSTRAFAEPIAAALKTFDALEPIAAMQFASGRAGWSLILARSLPWPLFLRRDLSAAFTPRAAQLSLLLRDARVVALDFDGESLWARFE
jgi:hypothetical protein